MLTALRNGSATAPVKATPVNRLFERFLDDAFFAAPAVASRDLAFWEDEHGYTIELDAPGVAEEDIDLTVHNGELVIQGERKSQRREGAYDGRSYGKFEQRITLPKAVDPEAISAKLAGGVLTLTVPKSEAAKPRKIELRAE